MEKMKDAVNAAAGGDGIPSRRIAGDASREYILQTEDDTKAKAALDAGQLYFIHLSAQQICILMCVVGVHTYMHDKGVCDTLAWYVCAQECT